MSQNLRRNPRALIVCPGRGTYSRETLGSLQGRSSPSLAAADQLRRELGRITPTELDAAPSFSSRLHLAGENASILTLACTLADLDELAGLSRVDVVAVVGNSMGWYTALTVAGALPLSAGLRLVETMGQYQADNVIGGQVVYPLVDADWAPLPSPELRDALRDIPGVFESIRLGGQAVIGGTAEGLAELARRLPPRKLGERDAPLQLPLHSAFHTPLMRDTSTRALAELSSLPWSAPTIPLVDGSGHIYRPHHADPAAIRDYTLGEQVVAPYDFGLGLRVALREYAPDLVILPGPGGNLGGAIGQVLVAEGWRGIRSRADFSAMQEQNPFLISMSRPEQRARLAAG